MAFDYSLFSNITTEFDFGLENILIPLLLTAVCAVAITRDTRQLRLLALPLAVGFSRIGLETHPIIIVLLAIVWGVTLVGAHVIGSTLSGIGNEIAVQARRIRGVQYNSIDQQLARQDASLRQQVQLEQAAEPYKAQLGLQKANFADWMARNTTQYSTAAQIRKTKEAFAAFNATKSIRKQRAILSAVEKHNIYKGTEALRTERGLLDAAFKNRLDRRTVPIQIERGIRRNKVGLDILKGSGRTKTDQYITNKRQKEAMRRAWAKVIEQQQKIHDSRVVRRLQEGIFKKRIEEQFGKRFR